MRSSGDANRKGDARNPNDVILALDQASTRKRISNPSNKDLLESRQYWKVTMRLGVEDLYAGERAWRV